MAEQMYTADMFFLDSMQIKQEPGTGMDTTLSSATTQSGMPIPNNRRIRNNGLNEFGFDLDEALSLGAMPLGGALPSLGRFNNNCSSSMPIPNNYRTRELEQYQDYNDASSAYNMPLGSFNDFGLSTQENSQSTLGPSVWVSLCDTFKMDEDDDILQVDKADLIQGPTLAELNANDETLLEDLSFDDLLLPEEGGNLYTTHDQLTQQNSNSFPPTGQSFLRDTQLSSSVPVSQGLFVGIPSPPGPAMLASPRSPRPGSSNSTSRHSTLHELLMRRNEPECVNSQLSPGSFTLLASAGVPTTVSRLSSSAPTHLGLEQIWQRREPRQHLLSTGSLVEAGSTSSLSTGGVLSPASHELSHDEGFDSEDDSDHYDDFSSDGESSDGEGGGRGRSGSGSKKERFFWQYNVQAKGPKGQRLVLKTKLEDPHVLNEVTDPVFSPSCAVRGIKHSGKARKGDGNDLTPNPRKLHSIGRELDKLGRVINDMTPVSELPLNVRPKSRKEKNKLASRACRLKKKAQHEANKIKLYGLEHEHKRLISTIAQIKGILAVSYALDSKEAREEHARTVEKLRRLTLRFDIAGNTTDFVNKILEKVKTGHPSGGLVDILN